MLNEIKHQKVVLKYHKENQKIILMNHQNLLLEKE